MSLSTLVKIKSSFKLKVIIVGAANSGKYSFCSKYSNNFSQKFREVIGVDIYVRDETRDNGEKVTYCCWNCSPQEKFYHLYSVFFRGALGALVFFDVSNRQSFEEIKDWILRIREHVDGIPIFLIGNKIDLKRKVIYQEALQFANQERLVAYIETSAKKNINISETFGLLNETIYDFVKSGESRFNVNQLDPSIKLKIDALRVDY
ncbi:MAG: GTP-binding protein [Promethearchaeota archaeon]|nr:MAG: GTP-binding protein [Candidatus Lokiarchaeota archaeon]